MASHHHQSAGSSGFVPRRSNPTAIRSSAGSSHLYGSARPRSLSLYSTSPSSVSSSSSYGGLLGLHSSVGSYGSGASYLGGHSGYGSPSGYSSPSSVSTYGGTSSGYGGLTIHHSPSSIHHTTSASNIHHTPSSSSIGGLSSSPRSSYYNSFLQTVANNVHTGTSSNSRTAPPRSSSFNRALTSSRNSPLSLASRSGSLSSLASTRSGSEGYSVRFVLYLFCAAKK